jgi:hypothetical protein
LDFRTDVILSIALSVDGNTISVKDSLELFVTQTVLKETVPIHGILKVKKKKKIETEE